MEKNIIRAQNRALQYWFVDGLAELSAGIVSLALAVLFWIWPIIFTWRWSLPLIFGVGLAISFGLRYLIQQIKERSTYLQNGYVAPLTGLESKRSVILAVAMTLLLLVLNYFLSTRGPQALLWTPAVAGLAFTMIFTWTGILIKLRRLFFLALLSLCVGVALSLLGLDFYRGVGILSGTIGLVLLYQGYRVHKIYIHQNPASNISLNE